MACFLFNFYKTRQITVKTKPVNPGFITGIFFCLALQQRLINLRINLQADGIHWTTDSYLLCSRVIQNTLIEKNLCLIMYDLVLAAYRSYARIEIEINQQFQNLNSWLNAKEPLPYEDVEFRLHKNFHLRHHSQASNKKQLQYLLRAVPLPEMNACAPIALKL